MAILSRHSAPVLDPHCNRHAAGARLQRAESKTLATFRVRLGRSRRGSSHDPLRNRTSMAPCRIALHVTRYVGLW